eukprot:351505-Chlamydomonas_euryale.AAC.10
MDQGSDRRPMRASGSMFSKIDLGTGCHDSSFSTHGTAPGSTRARCCRPGHSASGCWRTTGGRCKDRRARGLPGVRGQTPHWHVDGNQPAVQHSCWCDIFMHEEAQKRASSRNGLLSRPSPCIMYKQAVPPCVTVMVPILQSSTPPLLCRYSVRIYRQECPTTTHQSWPTTKSDQNMEAWANQYKGQHHLTASGEQIKPPVHASDAIAWPAPCDVSDGRTTCTALELSRLSAHSPLVDGEGANRKGGHHAHVEGQVGERLKCVLLPALGRDGGAQVGLRERRGRTGIIEEPSKTPACCVVLGSRRSRSRRLICDGDLAGNRRQG